MAAEAWIERKFAGVDTAPLFDETETTRRKRGEGKPKQRSIPHLRLECPSCGQTVSLYVLAMRNNRRVLGVKRHYRMTRSGASLLCPRSDTEIEHG